jgi:hypothetical protein
LTVDRRSQPSRQLGALRDSPDDVDHHHDLRCDTTSPPCGQAPQITAPEYRGPLVGQ